MNKNCIEGAAKQGERAIYREALVIKAKWRRCSGCADRWYAYMKDAIVEVVIGKDILQNHKVANPALFRQAFQILCAYPAQEISYTKLLGQLQDKGNTDLIKHYIDLYGGAFLLHALQKYSPKAWLARSSSPKMLPACPALFSMTAGVNVMLPDGQSKFPHPWPPQIPPGSAARL